ncbi:hypothetical protein ACLOJK_022435 [Asimina triloba]
MSMPAGRSSGRMKALIKGCRFRRRRRSRTCDEIAEKGVVALITQPFLPPIATGCERTVVPSSGFSVDSSQDTKADNDNN